MKQNARRLALAGTAAVVIATTTMIMPFESLHLKAYRDPIDIPTGCWGTTAGVKMGQTWTKEQCDAILQEDVLDAALILDDAVKVPMPHTARAAFISFIYNVGPGRASTPQRRGKDGFLTLKNGNPPTMLRKLRAGDIVGACRELPKWATAGGKPLRGLVRRRNAEMELCLEGL